MLSAFSFQQSAIGNQQTSNRINGEAEGGKGRMEEGSVHEKERKEEGKKREKEK